MESNLRDRAVLLQKAARKIRDRMAEYGTPFGAPASADELLAAEKTLGTPLPEDYAAFLRGVANGGPGPDGALFDIKTALQYETLRLEVPFPFTAVDARHAMEARMPGGNPHFLLEADETVGSVLPIATGGCSSMTYLVLAGPLRGTVWHSEDEGWLPACSEGGYEPLSFLDYWEQGMQEALSVEVAEDTPFLKMPAPEQPAPEQPAPQRTKPRAKGQRAKGQRAKELWTSSTLTRLDLRKKNLKELPASIGDLRELQFLVLAQNQLEALPESFSSLKKLLHLDLSGNPLASLPDALLASSTRLDSLDLSDTALQKLPEGLKDVSLHRLILKRVPNLDFDSAFATLATIPSLQELQLEGNGFEKFPAGLLKVRSLVRVWLNGNPIKDLPEELSRLDQLELLGLADCQIQRVPDAILLMPKLTQICLQGNPGFKAERKRISAISPLMVF